MMLHQPIQILPPHPQVNQCSPYIPQIQIRPNFLEFGGMCQEIQQERNQLEHKSDVLKRISIEKKNFPLSTEDQNNDHQNEIQFLRRENYALKARLAEKKTDVSPTKTIKLQSNDDLKLVITSMIDYLIENLKREGVHDYQVSLYHRVSKQCQHHLKLKELYSTLYSYYLQSSKTKEEMIKFIIRRCFKENRKNKNNDDVKLINLGGQLDFYCPTNQVKEYSQLLNDDMKKMSSSFIKKLFSSQQFREDYNHFFNKYDELADQVNRKKNENLVDSILIGLQKNIPVEEILRQTRRYPWLRVWLDASKILAESLPSQNATKKSNRLKDNPQRNINKILQFPSQTKICFENQSQ